MDDKQSRYAFFTFFYLYNIYTNTVDAKHDDNESDT